ncbi:MAG: LytTR family DNA-binding domain-containing protein [Pseudomonadota bacterium]
MSLRVLIVDDEQPARERLRQLMADTDGYEVVGEAANGKEAIAQANDADIVLLDIRMPGMDGLEAARHINEMASPPAIVFATAYDEYAIEAFDARAVGYVLKPVRRSRLQTALEQAARVSTPVIDAMRDDEPRRSICARSHGELKLIPVDDIQYFQADQKYVSVIHAEGSDLIDDSLKSLEAEFAGRFVRVHRNAIVAVRHIAGLEKQADGKNVVVLRHRSGDNALVVSRRHLAEVRRRLKGEPGV